MVPSVGGWFPTFPLRSSLQASRDAETPICFFLLDAAPLFRGKRENLIYRVLRVTALELNCKGLTENRA